MSEFEEWFIQQYFFDREQFNRFFKLKDGKYAPKTHADEVYSLVFRLNFMLEVWNHQQTKIDQLSEEFEEDKRFLNEQIQSKDAQINNLKYIQKSDRQLIASHQIGVQGRDLTIKAMTQDILKYREEIEKLKAEKEGLEERVDTALDQIDSGSFVVNDLRKALKGESFLEYLDRAEKQAEKIPDSIRESVREGLGMKRGES